MPDRHKKTKAELIAEIEALEARVLSLENSGPRTAELFEQAVKHSQDIIVVVDGEGFFKFISPSFKQTLGFNTENYIGRSSFDFVHPDDLYRVRVEFSQGINTHKPITVTYRARHKAGHWVDVESTAMATKTRGNIDVTINTRDISERVLAEKEMRESERRLTTIFNTTPDLMAISNIDSGVYLAVNDSWLNFYGFRREEIVGKSSVELGNWLSPKDREAFIGELKEKGHIRGRETTVISRDDVPHTLLTYAEKINFDGRDRLLTIAMDITKRKNLEQEVREARDLLEERVKERTKELEESEKRFKDFAEVGSDWIWETDRNHNYTYLSSQIITITENDVHEIYGKNRFANRPPKEVEDEPEKWEQHKKDLDQHNPFKDFQYAYQTKSKRVIHIKVSGNPIYGEDSVFLGYRGTGKNITNEVNALKALKENEKRLTHMLSLAPMGVGITKLDGTIIFANKALGQQNGRTPDELLGASAARNWVDQKHRQRFLNTLKHLGHVPTEEAQFFGKDGKPEWRLVSWDTITLEKEECILAWVYDIDEFKKAETALNVAMNEAALANKAKSDFLAKMSHELRTPMNAIIGFSDAMRCEVFGPLGNDKYTKYPQHIYDSGKHLLELIDDILDLAKIESGKMKMVWEDVNIKILVQNICTTIQPLVDKNDNKVTLVCPDEVGAMVTDYKRLNQILLNLLGNACKFTKNGEIFLKVERSEFKGRERMTFAVTDNGVGIAPENMKNLFYEFTQGSINAVQAADGSGLGLAISRRFAELMDGDISAESILGEGSTFTLTIPVLDRENKEEFA